MKYIIPLLVIVIILLVIPLNISQPSFNGNNPGCDGGGCHTFQDAMVSVSVTDLQIQVTVGGTSGAVAGELVDGTGTVVDFNNGTNTNPFTLNAPPSAGNYVVNAGHKSPLRWDSASVSITITDVGEITVNPAQFMLYDNYPNPFNPSTTIRYSIPEASFTTLIVYDALGNKVSSLVNETKSAGTFEVTFDATKLSSGIYYYTLQSGSITETKKMILTK
ncbi:MAG: T9SS type A sorting domain-containing protein [Ignavibacteriaceae bacterium]|nr:T9SS type A sorting domain-containing protein [Ignavibacteriaceae bacterium]